MEIKQHAPEQPMNQRRNQKRNFKKNLDTNENEKTTLQTYGMHQKEF